MKINGKVAIVTGGCQGIGKGLVDALLRRGAKVAVLDISDSKGKVLEKILTDQFGEGRCVYFHCDVADKKQLQGVFHGVKRQFSKVNIVVNNAAVSATADWEKGFDINLKAVIQGTLLGIDLMDKNSGNDGGVIVNMSSLSGLIPLSLAPMYTTTKAGVIAFTRCLKATADTNGVRVNCVCPAFVADTKMMEEALEAHPGFADIVKKVGLITVDMVVNAVFKAIEDDTLAGNTIIVTKNLGIRKFSFPKAKI